MSQHSRRKFLGSALAAGAMSMSCGKAAPKSDLDITTLNDAAPDGPPLKAGLIGCGGRGRGAAVQFINAAANCTVTALADVFPERIEQGVKQIKDQTGQEVPAERCFVGFDAYRKVLESGVDVVLLATPPNFRPEHFAAAVDAGAHVFMEKPMAVDPVGCRQIIETGGQARTKNLSVVTGTQRRHQKQYVEAVSRVADGAIGDIVSARCYWNMGQLWHRPRQEGWSDMEWMIRDWVNWCWLSGDHIVEQHVHNIDVVNWFTGAHPVSAVGVGARHRRPTGDQYDSFGIDFTYANDVHCMSMCRQISGCSDNVSEAVIGTRGRAFLSSQSNSNTLYTHDGAVIWQFEGEEVNPYEQEHVDLVTAIRTGETINEAEQTGISTLVGIMGRIAAYTGREITWQEMLDSNLRLGPTEYAMGPVDIDAVRAVPGTD